MAREKKVKVDTKDWTTCPLESWNGTTFRNYIRFLNEEKYGVPSITGSVQIENTQIKSMTKEYGNEVVKKFVEECVRQHKGNEKFPTVNFGFMFRFMKERVLPQILNVQAKKTKLDSIREKLQEEQQDVENYF